MQLNLRWSLKDVDIIAKMILNGYDAKAIAEAMLTTPEEIREMAKRNGWRVPR